MKASGTGPRQRAFTGRKSMSILEENAVFEARCVKDSRGSDPSVVAQHIAWLEFSSGAGGDKRQLEDVHERPSLV